MQSSHDKSTLVLEIGQETDTNNKFSLHLEAYFFEAKASE